MITAKKQVVLITTWFPPTIGVAVNRMAAFAKYLDKTKFDVTVITLGDLQSPIQEQLFDSKIIRLQNKRWFKLPIFNATDKKFKHTFKVIWKLILLKTQGDIYKSWRQEVINKLTELNQNVTIDMVISSFSPEAAHSAAYQFCSMHPNVKWIADMRDEMSQNPLISKHEKRKFLILEKKISQRVNAVTTVSAPLVNVFKTTTMEHVERVVEIRNGFDHEFEIIPPKFNSVFTMVYCGSFYGTHKPDLFFDALVDLSGQKALPSNWKLVLVGTSQSISVPVELIKHVEFVDKVSQEKSIEYMRNADATLFLLGKSKRVGVYSGKLFDYLSVQKPVLAIADKNDVAAQLVNQLNAGFVASNDNKNEIKAAFIKTLNLWQNKEQLSIDYKGIEKLHRKYQVEKLNQLIEDLINEK